jgi:hypothetical protein
MLKCEKMGHTQPVLVDTCGASNVREAPVRTMNAGECNYKNPRPISNRTQCISIRQTNWSILYREIAAVYRKNHTNILCEQTQRKEKKTEIQAYFTTDFILLLGTFLLLLLLLGRHYSPMLTLTPLMDFSQSALFF